MEFSKKDIQQIKEHGLSVSQVERQMENFEKGFPFVSLVKPAIIGDGILKLDENKILDCTKSFDEYSKNLSILKFVPASGAATRMFKDLYDFKSNYDATKHGLDDFPKVKEVIDNIGQFAFYNELLSFGLKELLVNKDYIKIVELILDKSGLDYGQSPKAIILFHKYNDEVRTAFEEHLVEGAVYCRDKEGKVKLHFTISGNHKDKFVSLFNSVKDKYEKKYACEYEVSFSEQKSSTDTIAVNMDNAFARDEKDNLIFRPSGHGALIENLDDLNADIIFIKNIDNVVHDIYKDTTYRYKKVLAGLLASLKERVDAYLNILNAANCEEIDFEEIKDFCESSLALSLKSVADFASKLEYKDYLIGILDRPMRVCGMVKNENQPGGGPFWIKDSAGDLSLQIVESAQVNMSNEEQKVIFNNSTHFNPVDLICSVKRYNGEKFRLTDFVDYETGFITEKTQQSQRLKVQELPGLWNGSMAKWISVFVEIPLDTFTPVKVLNNLLDKGHNPV